MRFDSAEHLEEWQKTGKYPAIHKDFADFIGLYLNAENILDLGCSYGLLGHSLVTRRACTRAFGIDANQKVIDKATKAGINQLVKFSKVRVTPQDCFELVDYCRANNIEAIVARRVFPELFGTDPLQLASLSKFLAKAGIRQIFVQGRVPVPNPANPLSSIDDEVRLLRTAYELGCQYKDMAYLKLPTRTEG